MMTVVAQRQAIGGTAIRRERITHAPEWLIGSALSPSRSENDGTCNVTPAASVCDANRMKASFSPIDEQAGNGTLSGAPPVHRQ